MRSERRYSALDAFVDRNVIRGQKDPMDPRVDSRIRRQADVMILGVKRILPIVLVCWTVPGTAQVVPIAGEVHEGEMSVDVVLVEEVQ